MCSRQCGCDLNKMGEGTFSYKCTQTRNGCKSNLILIQMFCIRCAKLWDVILQVIQIKKNAVITYAQISTVTLLGAI
jgi:hypothetical protein